MAAQRAQLEPSQEPVADSARTTPQIIMIQPHWETSKTSAPLSPDEVVLVPDHGDEALEKVDARR